MTTRSHFDAVKKCPSPNATIDVTASLESVEVLMALADLDTELVEATDEVAEAALASDSQGLQFLGQEKALIP